MGDANHPKNQHYVPQFLLRNFAGKKGQLAVFDKATGRSFPTSPRGIAAEAWFYDYVDEKGDPQSLEHELSKLEGGMSGIISRIIEQKSLSQLTNDERSGLAFFAALQQLRVKALRERTKCLNDGILRVLAERGIDGGNVVRQWSENDLKSQSALYLPIAQKTGWYFYKKAWVLRRAPTGKPFWISDNPITLHNIHDPNQNRLDSPGVEILFPISSEFSICFLCEGHRQMIREGLIHLRQYESEFGHAHEGAAEIRHMAEVVEKGIPDLLPPESVVHQNSLQVQYASRFVIAPEDDFGLAREMIEKNPMLRESPGFAVW
ncbi:MAG: DUF4238 domain-containing protein [Gemmataceae bacterium]